MAQSLIGIGVSDDEDGAVVVKVTGCVDLATAPALASTLDRRPKQGFVVDLSGLEFMDSTGISALLAARNAPACVLVVAPGPVSDLLDLTAMGEIFPFAGDVAEGLEILKS